MCLLKRPNIISVIKIVKAFFCAVRGKRRIKVVKGARYYFVLNYADTSYFCLQTKFFLRFRIKKQVALASANAL